MIEIEKYARLPKTGQTLCGLTRGHIYRLIDEGKIKSISLKEPGRQRGVRLVEVPSIVSHIESFVSQKKGAAEE